MNIVACIEAITKTYFFLKRTIIKIKKTIVKQNTKIKKAKIKRMYSTSLKEEDDLKSEMKFVKSLKVKNGCFLVSKHVMEFDKFMIIKQRFGTQIKMNLKNKNDINTYLEKNMTGLDVKYINPIINDEKIDGIFNNKIEHKNSTKIGY